MDFNTNDRYVNTGFLISKMWEINQWIWHNCGTFHPLRVDMTLEKGTKLNENT